MITGRELLHQTARPVFIAAALAILAEGTAYAQLEKRFAVGVSVVNFEPASEELSSKVRVVPTLSRVPRPGWGLALGLNWTTSDVDGSYVGLNRRLGKLTARPFMAGIGYTAMWGKFSVNPTIVAGPSWNVLEIDDDLTGDYGIDEDFEDKKSVISFAVRPGISATYAVHPRFGLTAFTGYLFNRPEFDIQSPIGTVTTPWKADGFAISAGVVVPVF